MNLKNAFIINQGSTAAVAGSRTLNRERWKKGKKSRALPVFQTNADEWERDEKFDEKFASVPACAQVRAENDRGVVGARSGCPSGARGRGERPVVQWTIQRIDIWDSDFQLSARQETRAPMLFIRS